MKKPLYAAALIFCTTLGIMSGVAMEERIQEPTVATETVVVEIVSYSTTSAQELVIEKPSQPIWLREIPLESNLQEFIYNQCEIFEFDYDTFLAIAWKESRYRTDVISKTNDIGLMQINKNNQKWVNQMAGRELNLFNPHDNITASLLILTNYRDNWIKKGISENKLMQYTLNSYNMGEAGYTKAGYPSRSYDREITKQAAEISTTKMK